MPDDGRALDGVRIRPLPYPYRSMLAICSDLDETPDRQVYWESARFLNTTERTAMGDGVGLEVGNTIYFDMPANQFSYWNTDDRGRAEVHALIRSGHIDCLHSFGDHATTRAHAGRALEALDRHGCRLSVWIDHAIAPSNLGADIMRGEGDLPGSPVYHADLTSAFGVRYVWRGRVTSVIGQDAPHSLAGVFDPAHAAASLKTMAKEWTKRAVGTFAGTKYAMNAANRLLVNVRLRDGQPMQEFLRADPSWAGLSRFDTADGLAQVITPRFLDRLARRDAASIVYTHLGKVSSTTEPFGPSTRAALRLLADRQRQGDVLVATTRRVLDYWTMTRSIQLRTTAADGHTRIEVSANASTTALAPASLAGLTLHVTDPERVVLTAGGLPVPVVINPPEPGRGPSVSVAWPRLAFPQL